MTVAQQISLLIGKIGTIPLEDLLLAVRELGGAFDDRQYRDAIAVSAWLLKDYIDSRGGHLTIGETRQDVRRHLQVARDRAVLLGENPLGTA